jgi:hypothetical protein
MTITVTKNIIPFPIYCTREHLSCLCPQMAELRHVLVRLAGVAGLRQVPCLLRVWRDVIMHPLLAAVCPLAEDELDACFQAVTLLHRSVRNCVLKMQT